MTGRQEQVGGNRYRPEIDGLRAVAIVPVVLFHGGLSALSGGFIGVDIFFVISGYLITSIIAREVDRDTFTILDFYKRRIIRILPALSTMALAVAALCLAILLPRELRDFGHSLTWVSLFASNFYFATATGYFTGPAEYKILLHMWSLAVEEQFYILFPILLPILLRKYRNHMNFTLVILCIASFVISLLGIRWYTAAVFYLLPGRAWELGLGALLALRGPIAANSGQRTTLSCLGIGLIGSGLVILGPQSSFPSYNALLPCVGAALLIAFGDGTFVGRVLSSRPFVAVGLISYPLYLWHWPVIVLTRTRFGADASNPGGGGD